MKYLFFVIVLSSLSACASRNYFGAVLTDDGTGLVRPLRKEADKFIAPFAQRCVQAFQSKSIQSDVEQLAGDELRSQIQARSLDVFVPPVLEKYGKATIARVLKNGSSVIMDQGTYKRPLNTFTHFIAEYEISGSGSNKGHLFLFIANKDDKLYLEGFDIHNANHKEEKPDLLYMPSRLKGWLPLS